MAIIKRPGYGMRDCPHPVLWFETWTSEASAALQVFDGEDADRIIRAAGVYDVHDLGGKPCWVDQANSTCRFLELCKIEGGR